jgi:hypothetical protein
MEQFNALLAAFGLSVATGGTALALAVLLRYARGMVPHVGSGITYLSAICAGTLGAVLEAASGQPWQATTKTALAMTCVVLLAQKGLEALAAVVPWLPKDNEWTAK